MNVSLPALPFTHVVAETADDPVVAGIAEDHVIVGAAVDHVVAVAAFDHIGTALTAQGIVVQTAVDAVVARTAVEVVVAGPADEDVVPTVGGIHGHRVVAVAAIDHKATGRGRERHVIAGAEQDRTFNHRADIKVHLVVAGAHVDRRAAVALISPELFSVSRAPPMETPPMIRPVLLLPTKSS